MARPKDSLMALCARGRLRRAKRGGLLHGCNALPSLCRCGGATSTPSLFTAGPACLFRRGLWTTPFMATGAKLWTAYDGPAPLQSTRQPLPAGTTAAGKMTGVRLTAPGGSARVVGPSDVGACKAYLTVVDAVLLPWSPAELAALASVPPTAGSGAPLGAALSSGGGAATNATDGAATDGTSGAQCVLQANTVFNATTLAPGASNRQRSGERGGRGPVWRLAMIRKLRLLCLCCSTVGVCNGMLCRRGVLNHPPCTLTPDGCSGRVLCRLPPHVQLQQLPVLRSEGRLPLPRWFRLAALWLVPAGAQWRGGQWTRPHLGGLERNHPRHFRCARWRHICGDFWARTLCH